ncbi:MAG TPA: hypothetical protein VJU78_15290, partial [Chitinophagaceae bacterium]|nr:hypothetical protein [Chitinophagaceae bacterium]
TILRPLSGRRLKKFSPGCIVLMGGGEGSYGRLQANQRSQQYPQVSFLTIRIIGICILENYR